MMRLNQSIDNPIVINDLLSFLIYGTTRAEVRGLDQFPRDQWPSPLPLLFYAYHIMAGLGTYFAALMLLEVFLLWRGKLFETRWALWPLLLSFPLPYIANTAGWFTTELGRQPWIIYGVMRTAQAVTPVPGLVVPFITFTLLYVFLAAITVWLLLRQVAASPQAFGSDGHEVRLAA